MDTRFGLHRHTIGPVILKQVRRNKNIVYGAYALNMQMPFGFLRRGTGDIDVYAKRPQQRAKQMERKLDKKFKGDVFFVKEAEHEGTWRVIAHPTKESVADYSKTPEPHPRTVKIGGIFYEHIDRIKKGKKKTLADPKSSYRHYKDKQDLGMVSAAKIFKKSKL